MWDQTRRVSGSNFFLGFVNVLKMEIKKHFAEVITNSTYLLPIRKSVVGASETIYEQCSLNTFYLS